MNVKKIIKGIVGLGLMGGVAYLAYKIGECNGEMNERVHTLADTEDDEDEDYNFYDYDEPDDACISPEKENKPVYTADSNKDFSSFDDKPAFAPISSVKVEGVSDSDLRSVLYHISGKKYVSNKAIRDILNVDTDKAAEVLSALYNAGYISGLTGNRIPVRLSISDYFYLLRGERK